jgi:hypothetical protein
MENKETKVSLTFWYDWMIVLVMVFLTILCVNALDIMTALEDINTKLIEVNRELSEIYHMLQTLKQ